MKCIHFTLEVFDGFCRVTMQTPVRTQKKTFRFGKYFCPKTKANNWIKEQIANLKEACSVDGIAMPNIFVNGSRVT